MRHTRPRSSFGGLAREMVLGLENLGRRLECVDSLPRRFAVNHNHRRPDNIHQKSEWRYSSVCEVETNIPDEVRQRRQLVTLRAQPTCRPAEYPQLPDPSPCCLLTHRQNLILLVKQGPSGYGPQTAQLKHLISQLHAPRAYCAGGAPILGRSHLPLLLSFSVAMLLLRELWHLHAEHFQKSKMRDVSFA